MRIDLENSKKLYFSLKEVSKHFKVNPSLLRFWEKEFEIINPKKTEGGTRQYTRDDIATIDMVYHLVKGKGMTLDGAKQVLKGNYDEIEKKTEAIRRLESIKSELKALIKEFEGIEEVNSSQQQ